MSSVVERLRRDPGLVFLLVALALAVALYAPTLGYGLVNLDDPWLVKNNWIVRDASLHSLHTIFLDLGRDTRAVLGAEYLPIRDVSLLVDSAVWGGQFAGFHLTNLVLYLAVLLAWFGALVAFGLDRRVCGLAILIWAVHPVHAETVAWISERKGVLALAFAGGAALAYAQFRRGRSARWLALAALAAVAAVWSKALAAFMIAGIGGLELALPGRTSLRRSLVGLGVLAAVTAAAMLPVLVTAMRMEVVSGDAPGSGHSWLALVAGIHGFYVRLATLTLPSAVSYPIDTGGPTLLEIVLGAVTLAAIVGVVARGTPVARAAALVWLAGWFPASRLVLPVRLVVVADRYLAFATLGFALALAALIVQLPRRATTVALAAVLVLGASARTLVAQASWRDATSLWARAVESNPADGNAWSMYAEALLDAGSGDAADAVIQEGLAATGSPRLMLRRALLLVRKGDHEQGRVWMQRAAEAGEPAAMANYALMLHDAGDSAGGLVWARRAVARTPLYAQGYRVIGRIALESRQHDEARAAFVRAVELEPANLDNRYNLGLAYVALGDLAAARGQFEACLASPSLAPRARAELAKIGAR